MKISNHVECIPASQIREMFELASKYDDVISLCIGEPDFETPANIVEAGVKALRSGYTKYVPNAGIPQLREAVAEKIRINNQVDVTWENVIITFGAGQSLMSTMQVILNPNDEVIVPDPCFPNYLGYISLAGGKPIMAETFEKDRFHITNEAIERVITPNSKAVLINSPSNPTGAVLSTEELQKIAETAKRHNLIVISDEPYDTIIYDGRENHCIASLPGMAEHVIIINSFSKSYAMTGWRIGYTVAPKNIIDAMTKLQESLSSCVTASVQMAAVEALIGPQDAVQNMKCVYEKRRNLFVQGLNEIEGISCIVPEGAFYAFPNITKTHMSSFELAKFFIEEVQVVATPGSAFGDCGEGFLRFSFAASEENLEKGIGRMKKALKGKI